MFSHPFRFSDDAHEHIEGSLTLEGVAHDIRSGNLAFRQGKVALATGRHIELVLAHSPATASFMYLWTTQPEPHLFELIGLEMAMPAQRQIQLPGQVALGAARTAIAGQAIHDTLASPLLKAAIASYSQDELVILPVLREGAKYPIASALYAHYGYYCDEAMLDSHHVFDNTVPRYSRRVETTILKDQDISPHQRQRKTLALIGDSIASGVVMLGVFALLRERFRNITQLEVIAPFATLRGLARLAHYSSPKFQIRVHVFETILNALPPDYYYSAHYPQPEFHIRPDLASSYRQWWGRDEAGNCIADTACAGYGWAEAFFNPRKQIQMINDQLLARHGLSIADIVRRNLMADGT